MRSPLLRKLLLFESQSEVPNMFDPEGNDLYEGYEDEDVGMEKGPDIVPGYHKVDDENNM